MILALLTGYALSLPVEVDGEGYLRLVREGRIVYARSATLVVHEGILACKGLPLTPPIKIPASAVRLEVGLDGKVVSVTGGSRSVCGRIVLARFDAEPVNDRGFLVSSRRAIIGNPGDDPFGVIRSSATTESKSSTKAGPGGVFAIQAVSEVESDVVTLGDLGSFSGSDATVGEALKNLPFGRTPPIGVDMPVTDMRVRAILQRAGLSAEVQTPAGAVVRRKFQLVPESEIVAVAVAAAQEKLGARLPLNPDDSGFQDFKAPLGEVELRPETVSTSGATANVTVAVYVGGRRINSRSIRLRVDSSAEIRAGSSVRIHLRSAGVTVEIGGKARTSGVIGQTITVVTDSGAVMSGIVTGSESVEVKVL